MPAPAGPPTALKNQLEQEDRPLAEWSPHWLGYSRYDGVVVAADELAAAPEPVRTALWQYAETGGLLLVMGRDVAVPPAWKARPGSDDTGLAVHDTGLGRCLVAPENKVGDWSKERWRDLSRRWRGTASTWSQMQSPGDANRRFRVVEDVRVPVRGLFVLMLVFAVGIGPLNLWLLGRRDRRMWMLWTVPAVSLLTCLLVFGYMLAAEGVRGQLRTEGLTILDQNTQRATSLGWTAFYAPLTPGDGVHFGADTEVVWQRGVDMPTYGRRGGASCTLDWTDDQHLAGGWVAARVPSHFKVRQSATQRRERLDVEPAADGTLAALNGLGADVVRLWVVDDKGALYTAERVTAGARVTLTPAGKAVGNGRAAPLRELFDSERWLSPPDNRGRPPAVAPGGFSRGGPVAVPIAVKPPPSAAPATRKAPAPPGRRGGAAPEAPAAPGVVEPGPVGRLTRFLTPGSYLAEMDGAPFFPDALAGTRSGVRKSYVLGILQPRAGRGH
jgi:hypothetical protein